MTQERIVNLIAQLPIIIVLFYIVFVDIKNSNKPYINGWRRIIGKIIHFGLALTWLVGWFGAFSIYLDVSDHLAWGYFGAAAVMQAILERSKATR